jgi:hypothetical protein
MIFLQNINVVGVKIWFVTIEVNLDKYRNAKQKIKRIFGFK